jgi:uncharacterized protein YlxP (DUF503 family)
VPVAKLILEIHIAHAYSLKDRRQVVRSLKDRLRHAFNLAIAEMDSAEVWNRATLGIAVISSSSSYLSGQLREIDQAAIVSHRPLGLKLLILGQKSYPMRPEIHRDAPVFHCVKLG